MNERKVREFSKEYFTIFEAFLRRLSRPSKTEGDSEELSLCVGFSAFAAGGEPFKDLPFFRSVWRNKEFGGLRAKNDQERVLRTLHLHHILLSKRRLPGDPLNQQLIDKQQKDPGILRTVATLQEGLQQAKLPGGRLSIRSLPPFQGGSHDQPG